MRNQYVNITRARDDIKIYTDDKESLKEMSEIKTHARDTLGLPHTIDDAVASLQRIQSNLDKGLEEVIKKKEHRIQKEEGIYRTRQLEM
jgi:protein associated with RNAse G/E